MKELLIGTSNISKLELFRPVFDGYDIKIYSLRDLGITGEPEETGNTPTENAISKAKYYAKFFPHVFSEDAGLYFKDLPLDDIRQPGLRVRRPVYTLDGSPYDPEKRLDDEEMIEYYTKLIHQLGGKMEAAYLVGACIITDGKIHTISETMEQTKKDRFLLVDTPTDKRVPGWPLNSISVRNGHYLADYEAAAEPEEPGEWTKMYFHFLLSMMGLVE